MHIKSRFGKSINRIAPHTGFLHGIGNQMILN